MPDSLRLTDAPWNERPWRAGLSEPVVASSGRGLGFHPARPSMSSSATTLDTTRTFHSPIADQSFGRESLALGVFGIAKGDLAARESDDRNMRAPCAAHARCRAAAQSALARGHGRLTVSSRSRHRSSDCRRVGGRHRVRSLSQHPRFAGLQPPAHRALGGGHEHDRRGQLLHRKSRRAERGQLSPAEAESTIPPASP